MELPQLDKQAPDPFGAPTNTIRAVCVEIDNQNTWEEWPRSFSFPPRPGDLVKSHAGRVAKIANVMHIMGAAGFPIAVLEIVRNTGGSSPVEAGTGALE